jgi:O-antigen ligase
MLGGGLSLYAALVAFGITAAEFSLLIAMTGALLLWIKAPCLPEARFIGYALTAYLAVKLLTGLTALNPSAGLDDFLHQWIYLVLFLVPLAAAATGPPERYLPLLAVSVIIACGYAIVQHFAGYDYWRHAELPDVSGYHPSRAFFSHSLTWAGFSLVAALFFSGLGAATRNKLYIAAALLSILGVLVSLERGPVLALMAGLFVLAGLRRRLRRPMLIVLSTVIVVVLITPQYRQRITDVKSQSLNLQYDGSRLVIWRTAWNIGKTRPWLGVGPSNFEAAYERLRPFPNARVMGHAHNQWLDEWATSGILGVLAFSFFYGVVAVYLWRRRADDVPLTALAVWAALGVAALFECYFSDEEVLMLALFCVSFALLPRVQKVDKGIKSLTPAELAPIIE